MPVYNTRTFDYHTWYLENISQQHKRETLYIDEKTRELEAVDKQLAEIENACYELNDAERELNSAEEELRHARIYREKELLDKDKREALAHQLAPIFYDKYNNVPSYVVKGTIYSWNIDAKKDYFDKNPDLANDCNEIVNKHYPILAYCQECKTKFNEASRKTENLRRSYRGLQHLAYDPREGFKFIKKSDKLNEERDKLKKELSEAKNRVLALRREKEITISFLQRAKEHFFWLEKWYNGEDVKKPTCMDLKDVDFRYLLKHVEECEGHHEDCKAKITIRCPSTKDDCKARHEHCKKYPNGRVAKYLNEKPKRL